MQPIYTAEFNRWLCATNSIRRASGVRPYSFAQPSCHLTREIKMAKVYKVGCGRFLDKAVAEKVVANKLAFAAAVNREGMTAADRDAALDAFFAKRDA